MNAKYVKLGRQIFDNLTAKCSAQLTSAHARELAAEAQQTTGEAIIEKATKLLANLQAKGRESFALEYAMERGQASR